MSISASNHFSIANGQAVSLNKIPHPGLMEFRRFIIDAVAEGMRLSAFFGQPTDGRHIRLWAILADDRQSQLLPLYTEAEKEFQSLTPQCPQAHWFEREIFEQFEVRPNGHPWLKPIRFHSPIDRDLNSTPSVNTRPAGVTDFFRVEGDEVHEVAVGPVHAGIIEPGHFRFQCHGEQVLHLEISLGYQHRGVEKALTGGPNNRTIHFMETLAGDTTIGHATAYCQAIEALAGLRTSARAITLRGVALELERVANHVGDLGALAGDVGFLPTMSYCGRIRGDVLNMTGLICGNRFGRGFLQVGGAGFDLDAAMVDELLGRLKAVEKDLTGAVNLLWNSASAIARFEGTGVIDKVTAEAMGLVGPAARACGLERDVRQDMPAGVFQFTQLPVATWYSGDVFARAQVRWIEIQRSLAFIRDQLTSLPTGEISQWADKPAANQMTASLVEGWRGEICHIALTDDDGAFSRYKIVDPSFHNWFGLAYALRNQQISDFPLCNKSFNLSYCGHDL